ncbi:MAG: M48 family metallopeptidase [Parvularculaceae bacterium]
MAIGFDRFSASDVDVRVNARARRIILRVDRVTGQVSVTVPSGRARAQGLAFAAARRGWIETQLARATGPRPFADGVRFPLRGAPCLIVNEGAARTPVALESRDALRVGGPPVRVNARTRAWLREEARRDVAKRVAVYAARVGRAAGPIAIRDTRSRWGSCTRDGKLSFSWRLILTPPEILDYVVAHECAHLRHLDHSRAFWRLVDQLGVDADGARDWFRRHGAGLFAWGVEPPPDETAA